MTKARIHLIYGESNGSTKAEGASGATFGYLTYHTGLRKYVKTVDPETLEKIGDDLFAQSVPGHRVTGVRVELVEELEASDVPIPATNDQRAEFARMEYEAGKVLALAGENLPDSASEYAVKGHQETVAMLPGWPPIVSQSTSGEVIQPPPGDSQSPTSEPTGSDAPLEPGLVLSIDAIKELVADGKPKKIGIVADALGSDAETIKQLIHDHPDAGVTFALPMWVKLTPPDPA